MFKNKCKPKPRAKSQEGATMVKRFAHIKKNMMMITVALTSYTYEKRERNKTTRGEAPKNKMQIKTRNKSRRMYSDGKEVLFI
jgi:hypothetical protein